MSNELDALMASGISLPRIMRPIYVFASATLVMMVLLYAYLQPFAQYRYQELRFELQTGALGAKIDVPTPKGEITLTVPPGTSSGRRLRAKGMGVPNSSGGSGDLYAEIQIVLPNPLDETSLDLIRQLEERNPLNPRTDLRW